jgi:hypothetical protein
MDRFIGSHGGSRFIDRHSKGVHCAYLFYASEVRIVVVSRIRIHGAIHICSGHSVHFVGLFIQVKKT